MTIVQWRRSDRATAYGEYHSVFVLGINAFHAGASACLIRDGQLIAAAEEERFSRVKYQAGFPTRAIRYVLGAARITLQDVDHIGVSRDPSAHLAEKVLYSLRRRPNIDFIAQRLRNAGKVRDIKSSLCDAFDIDVSSLRARFHNVEHHRAHLASAFLVSPFREAAVLSIDGMGDFVSCMWGVGDDRSLDVQQAVHFPHSLGIFYTAITQWLGFPKYGDEGKIMGLAPYGEAVHLDSMRRLVRVQRDGTYELDLDYFVHHAAGATMTWDSQEPELETLYSPRLVKLLGDPRTAGSEITKYHKDVAASLQSMLEEAELALVRRVHRESGQRALCLAGGVALNSAFNGKILTDTPFDDVFIQPAAGDAGTSLGVCFYIYHHILGQPRAYVMKEAYTGPAFDAGSIADALTRYGLPFEALDEAALVQRAVDVLERGDVLGWFQGRMEWGPRALGNRSILADPRRADMKGILNDRIKHREAFRPFAPSIIEEATGEYFEQDYPDPFMLKVYPVRPEKQGCIPAVTHVDGTGRLQTVARADAPLYWSLIRSFGDRTGVPVVLNTSFNDNEPIVCTPEEAIECFLRTRMDVLAIGGHLITKEQ
jgi:carbamoyltransferase